MTPDLQPQAPFPPNAAPETSAQKKSTNCTNSANSSISEIREISGPAPKISVIVPVYKVEKYLPECIESVLVQTFTDFELILVDDGSPDNCGAICDAYAARDPRVRVFHKENGGVTSARRLGVERSRGEWIMFVDGDDKLRQNAMETLLCAVSFDKTVDMVEGGYARNEYFGHSSPCQYSKFDGLEYALGIASEKFSRAPWGKIIRKSLFEGSVFPPNNIRWGEDVLMNLNLSLRYRQVKTCNTSIYYYRPTDVYAKYPHTEEMFLKVCREAKKIFEKYPQRRCVIEAFANLYFYNALNLSFWKTNLSTWGEFFSFFKEYGRPYADNGCLLLAISHALASRDIPLWIWIRPVQVFWKVKNRFF